MGSVPEQSGAVVCSYGGRCFRGQCFGGVQGRITRSGRQIRERSQGIALAADFSNLQSRMAVLLQLHQPQTAA